MLAYKMAERLYELAGLNWQQDFFEYLVFAAIATVCDIMDSALFLRPLFDVHNSYA